MRLRAWRGRALTAQLNDFNQFRPISGAIGAYGLARKRQGNEDGAIGHAIALGADELDLKQF